MNKRHNDILTKVVVNVMYFLVQLVLALVFIGLLALWSTHLSQINLNIALLGLILIATLVMSLPDFAKDKSVDGLKEILGSTLLLGSLFAMGVAYFFAVDIIGTIPATIALGLVALAFIVLIKRHMR